MRGRTHRLTSDFYTSHELGKGGVQRRLRSAPLFLRLSRRNKLEVRS